MRDIYIHIYIVPVAGVEEAQHDLYVYHLFTDTLCCLLIFES